MLFTKGMKILFIGDSLTDAGASYGSPDNIGAGYVRYIRDYMYSKYPELELDFINKGISGHRSSDLINRWEKDVLDIKPDFLSILIGTNDVWRQFDNLVPDIVDANMFEENLRYMVTSAKNAGIEKILIGEIPPIEKGFTSTYDCSLALENEGNLMIAEYNKRVHKIAAEFNLYICPLHKIFSDNMNKASNIKYTYDGVHPSSTGIMTYAISVINSLSL